MFGKGVDGCFVVRVCTHWDSSIGTYDFNLRRKVICSGILKRFVPCICSVVYVGGKILIVPKFDHASAHPRSKIDVGTNRSQNLSCRAHDGELSITKLLLLALGS